MQNLTEQSNQLAELENFDPNAFRGDKKVPQTICNFVLSLALIYNDIKDAVYGHLLLAHSKPKGDYEKRRDWGNFSGMQIHSIRYQISLVRELFNLIRKNKRIVNDKLVRSLVLQMTPKGKQAWQDLVAVSLGKSVSGPLAELLERIRNKVAFHYDPEEIASGYKKQFLDLPGSIEERPFISRGGKFQGHTT